MTYPPPGGGNPQYQLQPEPQEPSDPYAQPYGSTPPPAGNYYQQPPPQQYTQPSMPPSMPPSQPMIGVQQGYPSAPGSVLPPPIPPAKQGGNLPVILGVVVALVVVLGIAAVLIIPGMVKDDDPEAGGGDSETSAEPTEEEASSDAAEEPTEEEEPTDDASADEDFATWGTPVNSEEFTEGTPEAAALNYRIGSDTDDDALMQAQVCSSPSSAMETDLEWELENTGYDSGILLWAMSREVDGGVEVWVGWTWDDSEPSSTAEMEEGSGYTFTAVEEEGAWKLCDVAW
ncbi:hypothetical protein [Glycomyces sp. NPDC048151]|uniref:hypothetical protein n=1 Tax=Glycomyces sp. NPDC048151 TaxID=3364002 RepID=UPI00371FFF20